MSGASAPSLFTDLNITYREVIMSDLFIKRNCFYYSGKQYERLYDFKHNFRVILGEDDYDYVEDFDLECELFNEFNVHHIAKIIWSNESAPSAVNLVAAYTGNEFDHDPYDCSEGFNDKHTEDMLRAATPQEKFDILFDMFEILNEKLEEL